MLPTAQRWCVGLLPTLHTARRLLSIPAVPPSSDAPVSEWSGELLTTTPIAAPMVDSVVNAAATTSQGTPLTLWPPDIILRFVDAVHVSTELPWWLAISASTALVRVTLLPVAMYGTVQQAKMQGIRAELAPLQLRVQQSGGRDQMAAAEMHALYQRYDIRPMRLLALPLMQLPVFMSFFLGLRRLADAFPDAASGGAHWFVDLGARDTSMWLPAASALSALALVRLSVPGPVQGMSKAEADQAAIMKTILSAVAAISLPVASTMPVSVLVFWITNNGISLAYTGCITSNTVRGAFGLPPVPAPRDPNESDGSAEGASAAVSTPAPDDVAVVRAKLSAAQSLADMASSLYASGNLVEAVSMHARSVDMRAAARDKLAGSSTEYAGAAVDAQALRDALWRLREWQEQAGRPGDAAETLMRWEAASGSGGTPTTPADSADESTSQTPNSA